MAQAADGLDADMIEATQRLPKRQRRPRSLALSFLDGNPMRKKRQLKNGHASGNCPQLRHLGDVPHAVAALAEQGENARWLSTEVPGPDEDHGGSAVFLHGI